MGFESDPLSFWIVLFNIQVFSWRRKRSNVENPMDAYEYSKGIKAAGRSGNVDLAVKLFKEAAVKGIKTTGTYNAYGCFYVQWSS